MTPQLGAVLAMFFWAGGGIVVRALEGHVPPFGISFWRTAIAFVIIVALAFPAIRRDWPKLWAHWRILAVLGFCVWCGGNAGFFLGLQYTTAVNAGLLISFEPLMILAFSGLIFADPITRRQVLAILVSLSGVLVIVFRGDAASLGTLSVNPGDIIVLAAIVFWSLYATLLRKRPGGADPSSVMAATLFFGMLALFPFALWEHVRVMPTRFDVPTVGSALALAFFSSVIAIHLWNAAIARLGSSRAGQFGHLFPVFTVALAALALGETLESYHFWGLALIVVGLVFGSTERRRAVVAAGDD